MERLSKVTQIYLIVEEIYELNGDEKNHSVTINFQRSMRKLIQLRILMKIMNVAMFSLKSHLTGYQKVPSGEKPMDETGVGKPLLTHHSFLIKHLRSHTGERPMNINSARKPLGEKHTSLYTREFTLVRNPLNITNVGSYPEGGIL